METLVTMDYVSADQIRLVTWLVARGSVVCQGDSICEVECSLNGMEAVSCVSAPVAGRVIPLVDANASLECGQSLAVIVAQE